jgi:hypothetical protein
MMARSSIAPSTGRIQKRKTNILQIIIFGLQRAAGPYRWVSSDRFWVFAPCPLFARKRPNHGVALSDAQGQRSTT